MLREFIHWDNYPDRDWKDNYTIRENIEAGLPPEAWLKGTSLAQSFQHLADGKTPPPVQREPELNWEDVSKLRFSHDHPETTNADGPEQTPAHQDAPSATKPVAKVLQPAITVPIAEQLFGQPTIGVPHDSSASTESSPPEPEPGPEHAHRPRHKL